MPTHPAAQRQAFRRQLDAERQDFVDTYVEPLEKYRASYDEAWEACNRARDFGEAIMAAAFGFYPDAAGDLIHSLTDCMDSEEGAWPGSVALAAANLKLFELRHALKAAA